jgi:PAS domain S-box-containing protein
MNGTALFVLWVENMNAFNIRLIANQIICFFVVVIASQASAQVTPISLSSGETFYKLAPHLESFEDPFSDFGIGDVSSPDFDNRYQPVGNRHANFGITKSTIWLRFTIEGAEESDAENQPASQEEWLLDMGWAALTEVHLFIPATDEGSWNMLNTGTIFPPGPDDDLLSRLHILRIPAPAPNSTTTYYVQVRSEAAMLLPITLRSHENYRSHSELLMLGYGAFGGLIIALILFNVVSYAWVRDSSPLWYAGVLFFAFLYFFEFNMLQERFFPISDPEIMERLAHFFLSSALFMLGPFYHSFMSIDSRSRIVTAITSLYIIVAVPAFAFTFMPFMSLAFIKQYDTFVGCGAAVMLASSVIVAARNPYRPAKVLSFAWLIFCAFLLNHLLTLWGVVPLTTWSYHILQVGVGLISAMFSYAIWFRLNGIREEKDVSIRESEARYNLLAENISDVIWIVDPNGVITYVSPSVEEMRGYMPDEMIGHRYEEFMPPDSAEDFRAELANALYPAGLDSAPSPRKHVLEVEQYKKNGETMLVEIAASPIIGSDEKIVEVVGVARDITERVLQQEKHEQLESEIQNARKLESLGVLAGGVAHDFNNILVSVMGYTGILLKKLTPGTNESGLVQKIEHAAERASELANHMLAYSGRRSLKLDYVNLNHIAKEMPEFIKSSLSAKAVLQLNPAPFVPAIKAEATQIRQVLMNLLLNASDALEKEDGTITVTTGYNFVDQNALDDMRWGAHLNAGDFVFVEVSDTGTGMDSDTLEKIFEPFFTTKFTGRGLGMSALLGIVRSHSGAIDIESVPGEGTTFRIFFPKAKFDRKKNDTASEPDESLPTPEGTVLVIDDDQFVRSAMASMLGEMGMEVLLATGGNEGIDLYQENSDEITIVLLDMTMPGMQGDEVFDELKEINPNIKIIIISGFSEEDIDRVFEGKDLSGFLQKPFTEKKLREKIAQALAS